MAENAFKCEMENIRSVGEKNNRIISKGELLEKVYHSAAKGMIDLACETLLPDVDGPILELLPGPTNLVPKTLDGREIIGISPCSEDLEQNSRLNSYVIQNLNTQPDLPFEDSSFAAVMLLFGFETLLRPEELFTEVSRILKPKGLFLIAFASATTEAFADTGWMLLENNDQLALIDRTLQRVQGFGRITSYGTRKRYRSDESKKAHPVQQKPYIGVLYSYRTESDSPQETAWGKLSKIQEFEAAPEKCPYCGDHLKKWEVPHSPFEIDCWYDTDYLMICFNDDCPYFKRGWDWMWQQLRRNVSYRYMYHPITGKSGPMPVPTYFALKDGILEELK